MERKNSLEAKEITKNIQLQMMKQFNEANQQEVVYENLMNKKLTQLQTDILIETLRE